MAGTLIADRTRELSRWRADTPGCARVVHLNNAGAALVPKPVSDAVNAHLALEQELGGYEAADAQRPALRDTYRTVAKVIRAQARNISLLQSSTAAFAQAMSAYDLKRGDLLLTSRS